MKIDASVNADPKRIGADALHCEELGYSGIRVSETNRDPFIPLTIAADRTTEIELVTSVVVAFARNPMSLALQAHELNAFANGRLVLGIGSQVKPHIERRFSMPWGKPAKQMREFINAMKTIFNCWYNGERLAYDGEYYHFDLMPSTFTPPESDLQPPQILLSATGPLMTKVAAEVADGLITHPFSTEKYLKEVTKPAVMAGLAASGRSQTEFQIDYAPMIACATTDESLERAIRRVRDRIAFYGRTVAYRPVLEIHGWGGLQDELIALNRAHRRRDMIELISDDILHTIGIVGSPLEVVQKMKRRFAELVDRTTFHVSGVGDRELQEHLATLKLNTKE